MALGDLLSVDGRAFPAAYDHATLEEVNQELAHGLSLLKGAADTQRKNACAGRLNDMLCRAIYAHPLAVNAVRVHIDDNAAKSETLGGKLSQYTRRGRWEEYLDLLSRKGSSTTLSPCTFIAHLPFDFTERGRASVGGYFWSNPHDASCTSVQFVDMSDAAPLLAFDLSGGFTYSTLPVRFLPGEIHGIELAKVGDGDYHPLIYGRGWGPLIPAGTFLEHYLYFKGFRFATAASTIRVSRRTMVDYKGKLQGVAAVANESGGIVYHFRGAAARKDVPLKEAIEAVVKCHTRQLSKKVAVYSGQAILPFLKANVPDQTFGLLY